MAMVLKSLHTQKFPDLHYCHAAPEVRTLKPKKCPNEHVLCTGDHLVAGACEL